MIPFKLLNHHHHHRRSFNLLLLPPSLFTSLLLPSSSIHFRAAPLSRRFSSLPSQTFMDLFSTVATKGSAHPHAVAIRARQITYTYHQLLLSALKISDFLCRNHNHPTPTSGQHDTTASTRNLGGARIGIEAQPSAEFVAAVLGTWFSGGVAVPLALSYPAAELLHVISDSDVSMVLSTDKHNESLQDVAAKSDAQFSVIPDVSTVTQADDADGLDTLEQTILKTTSRASAEEPALIIYTSGTTGKPKGVIHTHGSVAAQVQTLSEAWEYSPSDQFLHCLPLHHVHGLFNALLAPLYAGSTIEFLPKFSVRGIWQRWRESYPANGTKVYDAITVFTGVPTMYTRLIQGYEAMDSDLQAASASASSKLRLMMCGSSALPYPVMQQWETITGHRLLERYGMTEFVMALSNPLKGLRKGGTVGKPFPGIETMILAEDDNGSGTGVGELCVRSPSLFKEYWKLPEITKQSFVEGGFFKTGDAIKVDEDGYYVILGRTSADIMKVGGYKLSALEIEAVLLEHPTISECCVLGLADNDYGEAVTAIIVPDADVKRKRDEELKPAMTLEELCAWAREKLAPYKLPTQLFLWESLPRNAMGKVNKKDLKKKLSVGQ